MPSSPRGCGDGPIQKEWFVIVSDELICDRFEAADWAPAILEYAGRIAHGGYAVRVSLRRARPHEIEAISPVELLQPVAVGPWSNPGPAIGGLAAQA